MNKPYLSIIVTSYNIEIYIEKLLAKLNKILFTTNSEIIFVDDGSQDDTLKIIKRSVTKWDSNKVSIYQNDHKGISFSRNFGISKAQGTYLQFIDGDDLIKIQEFLEIYQILLDLKPDVLLFNWQDLYSNGEQVDIQPIVHDERILYLDKDSVLHSLFKRKLQSYVWSFLAKTELWEKINFPVNRQWEDYAVVYKVLDLGTIFVHVNTPIIEYRRRKGSISTTKNRKSIQSNVLDIVKASNEVYDYFLKTNYANEAAEFALSYLLMANQMVKGNKNKLIQHNLDNAVQKMGTLVTSKKSKIAINLYKIRLYTLSIRLKNFLSRKRTKKIM